jgi:peptidylprolyl isomerase
VAPQLLSQGEMMSEVLVEGQTIELHYVGTFDDGTQFDSTHARGEPAKVTLGVGQLIVGFEAALLGMAVGETKSVSVAPAEAYGPKNPQSIQGCARSVFPEDLELQQGLIVKGTQADGEPVMATVIAVVDEDIVVLDYNHPMAGKNLNFEIEIVGIVDEDSEATEQEVEQAEE